MPLTLLVRDQFVKSYNANKANHVRPLPYAQVTLQYYADILLHLSDLQVSDFFNIIQQIFHIFKNNYKWK